jgi:propane monooxygenase small subunit
MSEAIENSGAAGAKTFPGSDSRKFNYYDPAGRKPTHYEDMTLDVQPDPKRYLLQDWILSFADGTKTYSESWTQAKSSDWHVFRAVDQEWERTHYQRQSTTEGMIRSVVENGRRAGSPTRFDGGWVKILQNHVGAFKHAEFGIGTATMYAQRYGYTQMINSAILTNASHKLRFAQDLTLYLGEIGMDIPGFDNTEGKKHWVEDTIWQGTRKLVETIAGATDPIEQYFAANVVYEPLVGELFRSGFIMQAAASQNDFMTPAVVSSAESDYERNLANTAELLVKLVGDEAHGAHNKGLFHSWTKTYGDLALEAAHHLQPIWSQPRVKAASFPDALEAATRRFHSIGAQIGFDTASALKA